MCARNTLSIARTVYAGLVRVAHVYIIKKSILCGRGGIPFFCLTPCLLLQKSRDSSSIFLLYNPPFFSGRCYRTGHLRQHVAVWTVGPRQGRGRNGYTHPVSNANKSGLFGLLRVPTTRSNESSPAEQPLTPCGITKTLSIYTLALQRVGRFCIQEIALPTVKAETTVSANTARKSQPFLSLSYPPRQ